MGNSSSRSNSSSQGGASAMSEDQRAVTALFKELSAQGVLSRQLFENFVATSCPSEVLPSRLFDLFHKDDPVVNMKMFVAKVQSLLDDAYKTQEYQLKLYTTLLLTDPEHVSIDDLRDLLQTCCRFGLQDCQLNEDHEVDGKDSFLRHLSHSCMKGEEEKAATELVPWFLESHIHLFGGLNSWLHLRFANAVHKSLFHMLPLPQLTGSQILTPSLLWYFCSSLPPIYIRLDQKEHYDAQGEVLHPEDTAALTWHILYDSDDHGLSLNRLKHKCFAYKSPMVTLIRFTSGIVIAASLDEQWTDSPDNFGGTYCQLIELYPDFNQISSGQHLFYLKEHGRSIAKGLHLGGGKPAKIEIDSDLNEARMIYKDHQLDHVIRVEVWGCGGATAALQQKTQKKWEAKESEKRKKVKNPVDWTDNPDRSILEMGGVCVSHDQKHE